jgi:hypothetical protein
MPLGSSKISVNKNRLNAGAGGGQPLSITLQETAVSSTVTYDISSNLPENITLYYTTVGDSVASDFTDNSLTGSVTTDSNGDASFTRIVSNNNIGTSTQTLDFSVNIVRSLSTGGILAQGNTHTIENIVPLTASASAGYSSNITIDWQLHKIFVLSDIDANNTMDADSTSSFNILDLGSNANSSVEVLLVGGGGGGGLALASNVQTSAGGGGGGDTVLQTVPVANLAVQSYVATTAAGGGKCANSTINVVAESGGNSSLMGYSAVGGSGGHNVQDLESKSNVSYPNNYPINDQFGFGYVTWQGGNGGDGGGTHGGGGGGGAGYPAEQDIGGGTQTYIHTKGGNGGKPSTDDSGGTTRNSERNSWFRGQTSSQGGTDGWINIGGLDYGMPGSGCPGNLEISNWYVGSGSTIETNTFVTGTGAGGSPTYYNDSSLPISAESGYPNPLFTDQLVGHGDGGGSWKLQGALFTTSAASGRNGTVQVRFPIFASYRQIQA